MFRECLEEIEKEVNKFQKVTKDRLSMLNDVIDFLSYNIKITGIPPEVFDYGDFGFKRIRIDNIDIYLFENKKSRKVLPSCITEVGKSKYLAGRFSYRLDFMDSIEILELIKFLPKFIENYYHQIKKLNNSYLSTNIRKDIIKV